MPILSYWLVASFYDMLDVLDVPMLRRFRITRKQAGPANLITKLHVVQRVLLQVSPGVGRKEGRWEGPREGAGGWDRGGVQVDGPAWLEALQAAIFRGRGLMLDGVGSLHDSVRQGRGQQVGQGKW